MTEHDSPESDESELYDTVEQNIDRPDIPNPSLSRRSLLKSGAMAGAMTIGGTAAVDHVAPRYSPIGRANALGLTTAIVGAVVVSAAAGVAAGWYANSKLGRDKETATADQTHRDIHDISRGFDSATDAEKSFENLVAEMSDNPIWEDAVLDFVEDFNSSEKDLAELKSDMRANIRSAYAERQKMIVGNINADVQQFVDFFQRLDDYGHQDQLSNVLEFKSRYSYGGSYNMDADWHSDWTVPAVQSDDIPEDSSLSGGEAIFHPFGEYYDSVPGQDSIIYTDYDLADDRTVEMASGWGDMVWTTGGTRVQGQIRYYDAETGDTAATGEHLRSVRVMPPDSASNKHVMFHLSRRGNALSTMHDEAMSLSGEVDGWVDAIAANYPRGELPVADVVSAIKLYERYGWEDGNASLTALYGSKLGFKTDVNGTHELKLLDSGFDPETDDPAEYSGDTVQGNFMTEADISYDVGDVVDPTQYDEELYLSTPSGGFSELSSYFQVKSIKSYEDGEAVEKESYSGGSSYVFKSRDADRYEEDIKNTENAREDAASNPEITVDDLLGGGGIGGLVGRDIPAWAMVIPGGLVILALFNAVSN
jgi:hypothetical protein